MNQRLAICKRGSLLAGAAALLLGMADPLQAGVPIAFPEGRAHQPYLKARAATGVPIRGPQRAESKGLAPELTSSKPAAVSESAGGSVSDYRLPAEQSSMTSSRANPRATRQMQQEQANKNNWAFEKPEQGLTQASDLEGKRYEARDIEKQSSSFDPTFKGLNTYDTKPSSDAPSGRYASEDDSSSAPPPDSSRSAPHLSPELSLDRMLAPIASAGLPRAESSSSTSLKSLLEPSSGADRQPGQDSLMGPGLSKAPVSTFGARDPINFSPDASQQQMAPVVGLRRSPAREPMPGSTDSIRGLSSSTLSPLPAPGNMAPKSSRIPSYFSLPSTSFTPAQQPPPWATAGSKDPMRRPF